MFTFREWIQFCEQPHIYAPSPISFKLDGVPYRNITLIDPRIEMWPDPQIKLRFMKYAIGSKDEYGNKVPPHPFYFVDDDGNKFEIAVGHQNTVKPVSSIPSREFIMPAFWSHYGQFRDVEENYIDNMQNRSTARQEIA